MFRRGEVLAYESRVRRADRSELIVEASASFIEVNGHRAARLSTIRDITPLRRAEAAHGAIVA